MTTLVALFMVVMAVAMAGMWTVDILRSPEIDRSRGLIQARDRIGSVMLPHWLAGLNSQAWVLADRSRAAYGIPIDLGLVGAVVALLLILAGVVPMPVG